MSALHNHDEYDGETTNEASNLSFKTPNSPLKRKAKNVEEVGVRVLSIEEVAKVLPTLWSTGEVIVDQTSQGMINWEMIVPAAKGSLFKASIFIEGSCFKMLKGVMRLKEYDEDCKLKNESGEKTILADLEVRRKPLVEGSYEELVEELTSLLVNADRFKSAIETPADYHKLRLQNFQENAKGKSNSARTAKVALPGNMPACT